MTRQDNAALHRPQRGIKTRSGTSSKGAAYRLVTTRRLPAGLNPKLACLKTAGGAPRDLATKLATSRLD
jgi:hypothetical protein